MGRTTVDFFWICDANYAHFLELGVASALYFHPDATLYVYDLCDSPSEKIAAIAARYPSVKIVPWPEKRWVRLPLANTIDFSYYMPNWNLRDELKYWSRKIRYAVTSRRKSDWIVNKTEWMNNQRRKILVWAQKAACAADCLSRSENNLIFLDADAIPLCALHDVFEKEFDVALTLRRIPDVRVGLDKGVKMSLPLPYHAVNAGVLFFKKGTKSFSFVDVWASKMQVVPYHMAEQTALSMLCLDADVDAFRQYEKNLSLNLPGDESVIIQLLSCDIFNNTYLDDCSNIPAGVKVAHFKGYLHQDIYFSRISKAILARLA